MSGVFTCEKCGQEFDHLPCKCKPMRPFGWYCELVHDKSGEVIRDTFTREGPLSGPDRVRVFTWKATALHK